MPREQVYTIIEAYFRGTKAILCDLKKNTKKQKKTKMQTTFNNGKLNFSGVGGGRQNHYMGEIFSRISKEMDFFYPLSLHVTQYGRLGWLSCPVS